MILVANESAPVQMVEESQESAMAIFCAQVSLTNSIPWIRIA